MLVSFDESCFRGLPRLCFGGGLSNWILLAHIICKTVYVFGDCLCLVCNAWQANGFTKGRKAYVNQEQPWRPSLSNVQPCLQKWPETKTNIFLLMKHITRTSKRLSHFVAPNSSEIQETSTT